MIGSVGRNENVVAKHIEKVMKVNILDFLVRHVDIGKSTLMTDESTVYKGMVRYMPHKAVNHQERYIDGDVHTNTLEGFWGLLKRAWYEQHHKYKVTFLPLYIAEACYKYNNRKREDGFDYFVKGCFD